MEDYFKYPRTSHFPWSPGSTSDDKILKDTSHFYGKTVVITEKMDGENTNMYPDRIHARSCDSKDHPSRHWVKGLWGDIKHQIPDGWRICGENLYAKHSIFYDNLPTYFMVFSIWDEKNFCLSWEDTLRICSILGLTTVPNMGIITYNEDYLKDILPKTFPTSEKEGFVIRNIESFHFDNYAENVAKWVRKGHINKNSTHWMFDKIIQNKTITNDNI